ncbi:grainyhead-like [Rhizopus azygosporus]|uniref:Grainyhead-like n=1 Tax=Rhizopus azygosporus TaxID=86630 RepID=A0A367JW16_RHIAZ|nr:grainyhead-like [Rhizopus azygosporus]
MSFGLSHLRQQSQEDFCYDIMPLDIGLNEMERNTTSSYPSIHPDLPAFHNPTYSDWLVNKSRHSFILESNPPLYPSTPTAYPIYSNANTLTSSTSPYHSNFSEPSQSSPTLFWTAPTTNSTLFTTDIASSENTPTSAKISCSSSSEVIFDSAEAEIDERDSDSRNPSFDQQFMNVYRSQPKPTEDAYYNNRISKVHSRFKSANACLSSYGEKPKQEKFQQFLSPPLPSSSLMQSGQPLAESNNTLTVGSKRLSKSPFQFHAVLHSPTAMMKKEDQKPITYLNRGQSYLLELSASNQQRGTLTSTISIAFHESSHRRVAASYWRFWMSQQMNPESARAIGLDENQTTGIYNITYPSFDKVTFDWHGRFGAKVYIRFHCLSTDFSRIKGVKGIPLRAVVKTVTRYDHLPDNASSYSGSFSKIQHKSNDSTEGRYEYIERCYCQIKLFRDKGAERKNKDDSKQINKQMEKAIALTLGHPEQHPLWPIINQPYKPVTVLNEVPTSPDIELHDDFQQDIASPSVLYPCAIIESTSPEQEEPMPSTTSSSSSSSRKKRKQMDALEKVQETTVGLSSPQFIEPSSHLLKKHRAVADTLNFYVWSKRQFPSSGPNRVTLESLTAEELKLKLATILSLHPSRVSEILWKRKKPEILCGKESEKKNNDMLVLVEDNFVAEHISDEEIICVDWEIKSDSYVRLILEF